MIETKGHDPLCHAYGFGPGQRMDICICTGIRIGRADERERGEAIARGMVAQDRRDRMNDLLAKVAKLPGMWLWRHEVVEMIKEARE